MKKNEKVLIGCLLVVLVIVLIVVNVRKNNNNEQEEVEEEPVEEYVEVLEDGTKLNTSEALNSDKMVDGLKFENIQLTEKNGQTVLLADVTNTTEKATELTLVDVIILDKEGNEVKTVGGIIAPLEPGASTQFNTGITLDYANSYDFKIVKK